MLDDRSAQSRIELQDGQTVVIGGVMQDKRTQTVNKVPLLGDMPIVGAAFRRNVDTKTKTELLIFLTPHVAPRPEALRSMSDDEMKGMKITPQAVSPGAFQDHMRGMQRGTTQPSSP